MCDSIFILHFFLRSSRFYLNITILLYNIHFTKKKKKKIKNSMKKVSGTENIKRKLELEN